MGWREWCGAAALAGLAVACGGNANPNTTVVPECKLTPDGGIEPDPTSDAGFDWDTHKLDRASCTFKKGQTPAETVGSHPKFRDKIKHVIVVLRENRSFDHYLAQYTGPVGGPTRSQHVPLPSPAEQPNRDPFPNDAGMRGEVVQPYHSGQWCIAAEDHEWTGSHMQFDNGKMDGFIAASSTVDSPHEGRYAMAYFDRGDLPYYYWLADHFAISESYHASLLGPTMANISFYYNATSCGTTENVETTVDALLNNILWHSGCAAHASIFDLLAANGISAKVYNDGPVLANYNPHVPDSGAVGLTDYPVGKLGTLQDFRNDVHDEELDPGGGHLPEVVFIEPNYGHIQQLLFGWEFSIQNDEHPPSDITYGQYFVYDIIQTLLGQPQPRNVWNSSVLFITWDENGGFYDHVVPPPACPPDDQQPCDFKFDRYGFRVPFFAVSPYAKQNYASYYTADHTSILRFIEAWHDDLPALTNRDANAWPLLDMFDFANPHYEYDSDPSGIPERKTCPKADVR